MEKKIKVIKINDINTIGQSIESKCPSNESINKIINKYITNKIPHKSNKIGYFNIKSQQGGFNKNKRTIEGNKMVTQTKKDKINNLKNNIKVNQYTNIKDKPSSISQSGKKVRQKIYKINHKEKKNYNGKSNNSINSSNKLSYFSKNIRHNKQEPILHSEKHNKLETNSNLDKYNKPESIHHLEKPNKQETNSNLDKYNKQENNSNLDKYNKQENNSNLDEYNKQENNSNLDE